jgi:hypothetical protein
MSLDIPTRLKESVENSKCEYRRLGNSGLRVSVPIFGCMSFGDPKSMPWTISEEQVRPYYKDDILHYSHDSPVRHFRFSKLLTIGASIPGIRLMSTVTVLPR